MTRLILITLFVIFSSAPLFAADDNADQAKALSEHYCLKKPNGGGPFPVVIMVPGCGGFDTKNRKEHYDGVQSRLVELGFATLRVNSLAARNATNCRQAMLFPSEGTGDIYIAVEYLMQQPFVKKEAINIIGWSWGGAATLLALNPPQGQTSIPLAAVVTYYPACKWAGKWDSDVPVLVLGASLDNIAPFNKCETLFNALPNRAKLTVRVYEGAHHAFDNPAFQPEVQSAFGTKGYNETAAKSAWIEATKFLKR